MFNLDSDRTELLFNAYIDEFHVVDKDTMFNELSRGTFTEFKQMVSDYNLASQIVV